MDTPGIGDSTTLDGDVYAEINRGLSELPPSSPVCLLLVFSLAARVGEEELNIITELQNQVFGLSMLRGSIIVWTHSDLLDNDAEFEEYLTELDPRLREMLDRAAGSVAVSNKGEGLRLQLPDLIAKAAKAAFPSLPEPGSGGPQRIAGRKSKRRQRQIQAGLLKNEVGSTNTTEGPGCVLA